MVQSVLAVADNFENNYYLKMEYKRESLIKEITSNLAFSSKSTELKNIIGLFDSNRIAQDFFAKLFSLIFGYGNLNELDKLNDIVNYPAIDLGDENAKIAFQITTQTDGKKIKDTINKFIKNNLYIKYDRLIVFIIGKKPNYTTTFDTKNRFSFDQEKDIWDDNFLIKEIDKLDTKKLEEIRNFLKESLQDYSSPAILTDECIKRCIQILKRDFGSTDTLKTTLNTQRDGDNFIEDIKNPANNLSWEFFKGNIRGHIQYNEDILSFLRDPINEGLQKEYLAVSQNIQEFYKDPTNRYSSFENVFRDVFGKLNTYEDEGIGLDMKLKILLHNMYFNCDIGDNSINND